MNVVIVTAVFSPEPVVSARLSRDIRDYLLKTGHDVHVVCPQPSRSVQSAIGDDPGVTRLDSYRCPDSRMWGRARESWDFGVKAARWIRNGSPGRWDVIYANVWPLFSQYHVMRAAQAIESPLVMHVQDVYPESLATKLPRWTYRCAAPAMIAFDRCVARRCAAVVLISDRIRQAYACSRRLEGRTLVVRNWVDDAPFRIVQDRRAICAEYGVPDDRFTFCYLGNLSALANLESAIEAFAGVTSDANQFLIVGEGSSKPACEALARRLSQGNILFRSEPDHARVARVQAMAHVFILPVRPGGAVSSTPSKCIAYMLSGRPIVAAVDTNSDVADDLNRAGCAWICPPGDIPALVRAMREAQSAPDDIRWDMGIRGQVYAREHFAQETCLPRLTDIIEGAAYRSVPEGTS